jgi:hypothetical protein
MMLSIVISVVATMGVWYGIDGLAGVIGVPRPSAVPWFHTLFQGGEHTGMSGM